MPTGKVPTCMNVQMCSRSKREWMLSSFWGNMFIPPPASHVKCIHNFGFTFQTVLLFTVVLKNCQKRTSFSAKREITVWFLSLSLSAESVCHAGHHRRAAWVGVLLKLVCVWHCSRKSRWIWRNTVVWSLQCIYFKGFQISGLRETG